ncbi:hypothetical protein [Ruminococcus sp.]|uniref:hypothetical protein n=1 Tax=Ruminococcus sp. TaxID=41978 RepID=UPI002638327B|nr:hypothetical protein [Ruminococcus sp.]MDD6988140.1 hypothetical protein [Ruminococcus sp.]MDY6201344.1 hypothetical protein [Ruminococcus sp.]
MKKPDKRETVNLFFSAFLIIAFIVCAHFFTQFTKTLEPVVGSIVSIALYVVFGLLLFYATRVGDGKAIKRFSLVTLIVLVIPSLYIIIASIAPGLPLYDIFAPPENALTGQREGVTIIVTLACVALGYGIPYTFLSGFEIEDFDVVEESNVLEGGIEADILDNEAVETDNEETETDEVSESDEAETAQEQETATEEISE